MGFVESIKTCFSKYFVFSGRASRSEFWWFYLFAWMLSLGGSVLDFTTTGYGYGVFYYITAIATFIPAIAAGARRLHDVNKSGWWQLIAFTIIGIILICMIFYPVQNMNVVHNHLISLQISLSCNSI